MGEDMVDLSMEHACEVYGTESWEVPFHIGCGTQLGYQLGFCVQYNSYTGWRHRDCFWQLECMIMAESPGGGV